MEKDQDDEDEAVQTFNRLKVSSKIVELDSIEKVKNMFVRS